jgi:transposase
MFIRKKANKSGTVSVQIIDKTAGYKVVKTIGSSSNGDEISQFVKRARQFIYTNQGNQAIFSFETKTNKTIKQFLWQLSNGQIRVIGPELILGTLFDRIGFNVIKEELFRHIVVARLAYPVSKLKTVDYLYRYQGVKVDVDKIYRFLDTLNDRYKDTVERLAFEYSKKILGSIAVVFYDMTTLYFESEDEDDLRKIGFSKDGKFQNPQIMLGLLVGENGYPIGYDIFEGNTFEGHTLLPVIEKMCQKYDFGKPIIVADAALLSKDNIKYLTAKGYQFIIGARIKNESSVIKQQILTKTKNAAGQEGFDIMRSDGTRLIVTYSEQRYKKDAHNRERGLGKLRQHIKSGRLTKDSINNRGYNKFLTLTGNIEVTINEEKIEEDSLWDGLKGFITNTTLPIEKVVTNYRHLWQIEKAFRISKTDLRIRPVYHYRRKRIEAHICIAFAAYTVYKELERLLSQKKITFSPKRAIELTHTMYSLEYQLPDEDQTEKAILKMDIEQKELYAAVFS